MILSPTLPYNMVERSLSFLYAAHHRRCPAVYQGTHLMTSNPFLSVLLLYGNQILIYLSGGRGICTGLGCVYMCAKEGEREGEGEVRGGEREGWRERER